MDLTTEFNNAAGGNPGAPVQDGSGPVPDGGSPNAEAAAQANHSEAQPMQGQDAQTFIASDLEQEEAPDEQVLTIEAAEAELQMLEDGRAEPELQYDLKAPPAIARCALTLTEAHREARIVALQAYLDAVHDQRHIIDQEFDEGLELTL